jgi:hypothetical protein
MPMGGTVVPAAFCTEIRVLTSHCKYHVYPSLRYDLYRTALPSPGFYPEISGFFEAVGIFLGFLFEKVNLGIFLGFFRKRSSKFRNGFFCKID